MTRVRQPVALAALVATAGPTLGGQESLQDTASQGEHPFSWAFHYDDEPPEPLCFVWPVGLLSAARFGCDCDLPMAVEVFVHHSEYRPRGF